MIMGIPLHDPRNVDHINGDGLDNRRENLRVCTHAENTRNKRMLSANTTGLKGVSWHKKDKKFRAQIGFDGQKVHLGNFDDPHLAHEMYCLAADMLHGEFANHGVNKK